MSLIVIIITINNAYNIILYLFYFILSFCSNFKVLFFSVIKLCVYFDIICPTPELTMLTAGHGLI